MDASQLPSGKSQELNGDGRPINLPGKYQHKESKAIYITAEGEEGVVQADALMSPVWNSSWERIGDVPSRTELVELREAQLLKDEKEEAVAKADKKAKLEAAVKGK